MFLRPRRGNWDRLLEKRDSSTTPPPVTSTTSTTFQAGSSQSTLAIGPGGALPPPPPTDGPVPPSGGPKPPKPPNQTSTTSKISTTSTTSTPSITSVTSTSTSLSTTTPISSQTQSSLFANGVGTLPTNVPTSPQKQPAPSLTSAESGISSVNESSATAIKAASAIIAVEATVIIAVLLLILYKIYIRKRQKQPLNGVKWAIGHTNQVWTPPYNDGNVGSGTSPLAPAPAVLRNDGSVWMGPGIVQTSVFSSQTEHQAQVQAPYMQQLGNKQPLGSNPPGFGAASHDVENPFFAPNEKALPKIQDHEVREQMRHGVPEIHVQASPSLTPHEAGRLRMNNMSEKTEGIGSRGEKELLEMGRELEDLGRERGRQGGRDHVSGSF